MMRPSSTDWRMRSTSDAHSRWNVSRSTSAAGAGRVHAGPEQALGPQDVADAGDHRLVEEGGADGAGERRDRLPRPFLVRRRRPADRGRGRRPARPTPASSSSSHVPGAIRSHATAGVARRTRTWGRGGRSPARRIHLPCMPRWVCRPGPSPSNRWWRCLPYASTAASRPAVERGGAVGEPALGRAGARSPSRPARPGRGRAGAAGVPRAWWLTCYCPA